MKAVCGQIQAPDASWVGPISVGSGPWPAVDREPWSDPLQPWCSDVSYAPLSFLFSKVGATPSWAALCEMTSPTVFFCRSRPQGCDAIDLVRDERRVFIGYPAWRKGRYEQDHNFHEAIRDLSSADQDQVALDSRVNDWRPKISAQRNLVREVVRGSIVLRAGSVCLNRTLGSISGSSAGFRLPRSAVAS